MKRLLYLIALFAVISACTEKNIITGLDSTGSRYTYIGYDSTGAKIVKGWIEIHITDSAEVSGNWNLSVIGNPQNIGPQTGAGQVSGIIEDEKIFLDLNPNFRDNNVVLFAEFYKSRRMEGQWNFVGFPGVLNYGSFAAIKQ